MAIAISLVRGAGERGPGGNWVRFAKCASGFILFGLGSKLGSFRKSLSCASQMFESGGGCEREVRGAGGEELGSFRKLRSRASRVFENGIGFVSQLLLGGLFSLSKSSVARRYWRSIWG